jgi:hypothetical protein
MLKGNLALGAIIFGFVVFAYNAGVLKNLSNVFFGSKES